MKLKKRLIGRDNPGYAKIGKIIRSEESVVGIDARHTHIIIIKKLMELEEKLDAIGKAVKKKKGKRNA